MWIYILVIYTVTQVPVECPKHLPGCAARHTVNNVQAVRELLFCEKRFAQKAYRDTLNSPYWKQWQVPAYHHKLKIDSIRFDKIRYEVLIKPGNNKVIKQWELK